MFPREVGLVNDTDIKQFLWGLQRLDNVLSTMPASKYVVSQSLPLSLLLIDHEKDPYQGRNILHSSERRLLHGSQSIRTFPRINTLPGGAIGLSVGHSFKGGFEDEKSSSNFWILTQILGACWKILLKFHFYRLSPKQWQYHSLFLKRKRSSFL